MFFGADPRKNYLNFFFFFSENENYDAKKISTNRDAIVMSVSIIAICFLTILCSPTVKYCKYANDVLATT